MTGWSSTDLAAIDRIDEIQLATRRADGLLRTPRILWAIRVDDAS
jgi:hypothetical protein